MAPLRDITSRRTALSRNTTPPSKALSCARQIYKSVINDNLFLTHLSQGDFAVTPNCTEYSTVLSKQIWNSKNPHNEDPIVVTYVQEQIILYL